MMMMLLFDLLLRSCSSARSTSGGRGAAASLLDCSLPDAALLDLTRLRFPARPFAVVVVVVVERWPFLLVVVVAAGSSAVEFVADDFVGVCLPTFSYACCSACSNSSCCFFDLPAALRRDLMSSLSLISNDSTCFCTRICKWCHGCAARTDDVASVDRLVKETGRRETRTTAT